MSTFWATDLHYDQAPPAAVDGFLSVLRAVGATRLIISGDIGTALTTPKILRSIVEAVPGLEILYVLGNHDYYGNRRSIAETTSDIEISQPPGAMFLPRGGVSAPEIDAHIVGVSGWASGEHGELSEVELDDFYQIHEFDRMPSKKACLDRMHALAQQSAMMVGIELRNALRTPYKTIILVTHVPPYPEAAWMRGEHSDPAILPYFCNRSAGRIIDRALPFFEQAGRRLIVLCGHTHSGGIYYRSECCTVYTGGHRDRQLDLVASITSRGVERRAAYSGECTYVPESRSAEYAVKANR